MTDPKYRSDIDTTSLDPTCPCCGQDGKRIRELEALVAMGVAVVDDFLPSIGKCALQDYGRMNDFMIQARPIATALLEKQDE